MVAFGMLAAVLGGGVIVAGLQVDEWHRDRVMDVDDTVVRGTSRPGWDGAVSVRTPGNLRE